MQERRMFERIDVPLKIKYTVMGKPHRSKTATSKNLGGGGISLSLKESLDQGTILKLDIGIPGEKGKVTSAYGAVTWSRKIEISGPKPSEYYETGIRFTGVDPVSIGKVFRYFTLKNG